jgi:hypothetical protein
MPPPPIAQLTGPQCIPNRGKEVRSPSVQISKGVCQTHRSCTFLRGGSMPGERAQGWRGRLRVKREWPQGRDSTPQWIVPRDRQLGRKWKFRPSTHLRFSRKSFSIARHRCHSTDDREYTAEEVPDPPPGFKYLHRALCWRRKAALSEH